MRTTTPRALYREVPGDPAYVVINGEVVGTFTPLALAVTKPAPATFAEALAGGPPVADVEREVVAELTKHRTQDDFAARRAKSKSQAALLSKINGGQK